MTEHLTRRAALGVALAAPMILAFRGAGAAEPVARAPSTPRSRRFTLGDMSVTVLLVGTSVRENPRETFGLNVDAGRFAEASRSNFLPVDAATTFFTPTLVETGEARILFDTGLNDAGILAALADAGYAPGDVTHVVITHMHGDHIGGLTSDGGPTFPDAEHVTGQVEFDHWAASGDERFARIARPLSDRFSFVGDGAAIAPGVTSVAAFGHTPGHMAYMLESAGESLLLTADLANHHVWSLGYPDWEVRFDMDKPAAARSRRRLLGMLAADRVPMIGYHMPFPAAGYVEPREDGFRYVPVSYQLG